MTHPLEKAAEEYCANYSDDDYYSYAFVAKQAYLAGARWETQRTLDILRDTEAAQIYRKATGIDPWAWLEQMLSNDITLISSHPPEDEL